LFLKEVSYSDHGNIYIFYCIPFLYAFGNFAIKNTGWKCHDEHKLKKNVLKKRTH